MSNSLTDNVWFPDIELLELFYKRKFSHFHGLDHVLRVWTIAMHLAKDHTASIDLDVLSAAALLHDIGRDTDFREKGHGLKSATWIEEVLPVIAPEFTKGQLEFIKILTILHCQDDEAVSTLELKILKDADALDRYRLPNKRIKRELLRLPESEGFIEQASKFTTVWRKNRKRISVLQQWKESAEQTGFGEYIPSWLSDSTSDYDKVRYTQRVKVCDLAIHRTRKLCKQIEIADTRSNLTTKTFDRITNFTRQIRTLTKDDDLLSCATRTYIYEYLWESLYVLRTSKSHSKEVEARKDLFLKHLRETLSQETKTKDRKTQYLFLQLNRPSNYKNVRKALIEYYSKYSMTKELKLIVLVSTKKLQSYVFNTFSRIATLSDRISLGTSFYIKEPTYKWTNLKLVELWIDALEDQISKNKGNSGILSEYLLGEVVKLIKMAPFNLIYINTALRHLRRLLAIIKSNDLPANLNLVEDLFQKELTTRMICKLGKCGLNQKVNLFYLYSPHTSQNEIGEYFENIESIIMSLSEVTQIDGVFKNYLLPLYIAEDWDYELNEDILSKVKRIDLIKLYREIQDLKDSGVKNLSYEIVRKKSRKNLESLLNPQEFESYLAPDENYRVVCNVSSFELIGNIITNKTDLLSIINISDFSTKSLTTKLMLGAGQYNTYLYKTFHRDALHRHVLQRKPNIRKDHVYYGALQNIKKLKKEKNIYKLIPTPTEIAIRQRYGNVILVFNKEVRQRTTFVLYDSVGKNNGKPVIFEEAKYLFEKVSRKPIQSSLGAPPISILTVYVEANIHNGASLSEVETIIAPKKLRFRKAHIIRLIQRHYPQIKFEWI